ncbi:MAG TPA: MFS transporter [Chloroflexota bacterium]|nr:MFS transporter [Chloroflexota bacterium]
MSVPEAPSGGESRHQLVLSLYLPAFILGLGTSIAAPAIPVYARSFDVSFGVAALVLVANGLGSAAATLPIGYLLDRIGRRKIVLAGPLLTALTSFLVAAAQSFPELLIYRFIAGWALQMWVLGRLAMITDRGGDRRGRQITGLYGMDSAGRLLGPAVGGFAAAAWDIRVPFILYGVLALVAIIPSFRLVRETQTDAAAPARGERADGGGRLALATFLAWPLLVLFAIQLLASLTRGAIWGGTLDLFVVYAYGVGPEVLGVLVTATSAIGVPITFAAGHLMDRFGRKATLVPGLALLSGGLISMAAIAYLGLSLAVYAASLFWVRAALSITSGSMQVLASDNAPAEARGRFLGAWRLIAEIGQVLSPVTFAGMADALGFAAAFGFLGCTSLGAAVLLGVGVRDTKRQVARAPTPSGA